MTDKDRDFDTFMSDTLVALADANPGITAVLQTSASRWSVGFETEEQIDLELFEIGQRVMLSTTVPATGDETLERAKDGLLAYNLMWRESGNIRTALAGTEIFLITDLPVATIDSDSLNIGLDALRRARAQWARFLTQNAAAPVDFTADHILRA